VSGTQVGKLIEQLLLVGRKTRQEGRILQQLLSLRERHLLQLAQLGQEQATPLGRQSAPARQHLFAHLPTLLRRQALPDLRTAPQFLSLLRRQSVPLLETLSDARLLFGRQTQEPSVVAQESLLLFWRHLLQSLKPPGWQRPRRLRLHLPDMHALPTWSA
jgi:hypothetical protein